MTFWLGYMLLGAIVCVASVFVTGSAYVFHRWEVYLTLAIAGSLLLMHVGWSGGTRVFLREKERRTIETFAMSVNSVRRLYTGKLLAILNSLRSAWLGILLPLGASMLLFVGESGEFPVLSARDKQLLAGALALVIGTAVGTCLVTLIGMVFGMASRNRRQLILAYAASPLPAIIVLAVLASCLLSWIGILAIGAGIAALWRNRSLWSVWSLSYLLGLTLIIAACAAGVTGVSLETAWWPSPSFVWALLFWILVNTVLAAAIFVGWLRVGIRSFEVFLFEGNRRLR